MPNDYLFCVDVFNVFFEFFPACSDIVVDFFSPISERYIFIFVDKLFCLDRYFSFVCLTKLPVADSLK